MSTPGRGANIVFIQSDSMDGRVMGCAGHPAMAGGTPNLDALARRGVLFRNASCNSPLCCPSRASMWSGLFTHRCEGWNNYKGLAEGEPTFRTRLDEADYLTQTFGKTDYLSGRHTPRARVLSWTGAAGIPRPGYRLPEPLVHEDDRPRVHEIDWRDVDRSIEWLAQTARADRPFMLYLGIRAPHPAFATSQRYFDMIDPAGAAVPPQDESDHPVMRYMRAIKNWQYGFAAETVRRTRRIYFAMIAEVDAMVGEVLAAVDELALRDSTYVIFASDHGEMALEHRQDYKQTHYEPSARVPLIVAGPGVCEGAVVDSLTSLVDIYPTLMDMASAAHPPNLDGHSVMGDLTGRASDRPGWVLSEFHGEGCNASSFMLRAGDWKYIAYTGYEPQLFSMADDPDEVRNLAGARPEVAADMDGRLREIVDYEAVAAKVAAYSRQSFRRWRDEHRAAGTYEQTMARIYSGWNNVPADELLPWTAEDEALIEKWLAEG